MWNFVAFKTTYGGIQAPVFCGDLKKTVVCHFLSLVNPGVRVYLHLLDLIFRLSTIGKVCWVKRGAHLRS